MLESVEIVDYMGSAGVPPYELFVEANGAELSYPERNTLS